MFFMATRNQVGAALAVAIAAAGCKQTAVSSVKGAGDACMQSDQDVVEQAAMQLGQIEQQLAAAEDMTTQQEPVGAGGQPGMYLDDTNPPALRTDQSATAAAIMIFKQARELDQTEADLRRAQKDLETAPAIAKAQSVFAAKEARIARLRAERDRLKKDLQEKLAVLSGKGCEPAKEEVVKAARPKAEDWLHTGNYTYHVSGYAGPPNRVADFNPFGDLIVSLKSRWQYLYVEPGDSNTVRMTTSDIPISRFTGHLEEMRKFECFPEEAEKLHGMLYCDDNLDSRIYVMEKNSKVYVFSARATGLPFDVIRNSASRRYDSGRPDAAVQPPYLFQIPLVELTDEPQVVNAPLPKPLTLPILPPVRSKDAGSY
jgi:hypothetical protein